VNFNLAPVVDLNVYPQNPIIGRYGRSFSAQASLVAAHASAWIDEHRRTGIGCCIKHFPGHGSSRSDSHLGFVDITDTWQEEELEPYRLLLDGGQVGAVMVGHLFHKTFDPVYPRGSLNFHGLVVSDDMQMKAITSHYGLAEGCCRALAAGVDLLIVGNNLEHDPHIFKKLKAAVLAAVDRGMLTEERIDEAYSAVENFKKSL
jgi:beta-N-acetylhexosaminidase